MFGICMYVYGLLALVIFVLYFCQFICGNLDQYSYVLHGNVISKSPWEYHNDYVYFHSNCIIKHVSSKT